MATLYGGGRGKSKSRKPVLKEKPKWIKMSNEEIEKLIVDLAKKDIEPEKIGLILRDQYGIGNVKAIIGKKICQVLKEHGLLKLPSDLLHLIKRAKSLQKHLEKNKHDYTAKRGLQLTESKINRLVKYYIRQGVLPAGFKYKEVRI